jgi:hypothetical protein
VNTGFESDSVFSAGENRPGNARTGVPLRDTDGPFAWRGKQENADYGALFEQNQAAQARALIVKGRFIIAPSSSGIMMVNIRRAWERILYEKTLKALSKNVPVTQTALFPVQVQVGAASRLLFEEHASTLAAAGFDITPFGTDTIVVNGVPEVKHKIGEPMHKTADGKETKEYAAITQMPVWGFLKKNLEGQFFWLKGYDPMTRIDREINQGRMVYLDTLIGEVHDDKGLDTGSEAEGEQKVEKLPDAPDLNNLG